MNYLRGAFNAASQYYRELPPINPATLTGAIDVIVIERRNEHGEIELACSPFHVRFGKWQVLRPAEKQVTVLLNGHPIPFNMKIGDAGEAFFVFETEQDVPADLITSPILQPIKDTVPPPEDESGRFGAREDKPITPSADSHSFPQIPPHEPDFLDLDSPLDGPQEQPKQPHDEEALPQPPPPKVDVPEQSHEPEGSTLSAIRTTATTVRDFATNIPRLVRSGSTSSSPGDLNSDKKDSVDSVLPREDIQAPDVTYHRDVVLDLAGYHSKGPSERTVMVDDKWDENSDTKSSSAPSPEPSRTPTPEYPDEELSEDARPLRSTSAPPEYGGVSTSPPEHSWDWAALPQQRSSSPRKEFDHRSSRLEPSPSQRRSRSPIPEAEGGKLEADTEDPFKIWLEFQGQRFSFELSLCGVDFKSQIQTQETGATTNTNTNTTNTTNTATATGTGTGSVNLNSDENGESLRLIFNSKRIAFRTLLDDEDVLLSDQIVVRWDDEYIFGSDNSPLMSTLVKWRRRTLTENAQRRPSEKTANISPTSSPTAIGITSTTITPPSVSPTAVNPAVRARTWSRWWSRSYAGTATTATSNDVRPPSQPQPHHSHSHPHLHLQGQSISTPVSASASTDRLVPSTVPNRALTPDTLPPPPSSVPFPQQHASPISMSPPKPPLQQQQQLQPEVPRHGKKYAKTLRLTSDQLKTLNLNKGSNSITFSLSATGQVACTARIFMWDSTDQVVVSDIDGTITKSDALGHVFTLIGRDWTHLGVAKLYSDISRNGYKIMYLTSRAIGQADSTRDYLRSINQNGYQLPEGPVIMSPDRLLTSLHREVIMRKPEVFKMACLKDIRRLFGPAPQTIFYAGFGNRITDALSYRSVDIPSARIFTIDSSGEVKMELLELAGYKSSYIHMTDLVDQMFPPINRTWAPEYTDFNFWRAPIPDIELPELTTLSLSSPSPSSTFPVVTPPSPALSASARSDVSVQSTLSRLRNFSLGRGRSTASSSRAHSPDGSGSATGSGSSSMVTPKDTLPDVYDNNNNNNNTTASSAGNGKHIRSAVSLDRLGSFLPSLGSAESIIPSYHNNNINNNKHNGGEEEGEEERGRGKDDMVFVPNGWGVTGYRKSRPGSMPGSLDLGPSMHDPRWLEGGEEEEEEEEGEEAGEEGEEDGEVDGSRNGGARGRARGGSGSGDAYGGYGGYAEHGTEQSFDDDLIATGEMENVPYL